MKQEEIKMRAEAMHAQYGLSIEDCLKKMESVGKLYDALTNGVVRFSFKKKDGSIRDAVGTLVKDSIEYEFKGTGKSSPLVIPYWDVEKKSFRSFDIINFIKYEL